jgi:hypothetical protein
VNWKAAVVAFIALGLLENVLAHRQALNNVGAAENGLVGLLQKFIDPNTPAFKVTPAKPTPGTATTPNPFAPGGQSPIIGGTPILPII